MFNLKTIASDSYSFADSVSNRCKAFSSAIAFRVSVSLDKSYFLLLIYDRSPR
jgi:hypothetical protein